jgi:PAS domain S-box-containing protein/putative nucleotidyltransferase with HDIG domain
MRRKTIGENDLATIVDCLLEGLQIIGFDWRYLYVNEAVARHGRTTKEKLLGHTMMEAYPGIEQTHMFSILNKCMKERTSASFENEFTFPDGSQGWYELRMEPVPEGVSILSIEITDRKRAQDIIEEIGERYQTLFGRSVDCVYLHDFEGRFIDANRAALNLLGYSIGELTSLNFASLLTPDQIPAVLKATEEVKTIGFQKEISEFRLRKKNGEEVFVETNGSLIYREGKPYAIQGIARDITSRKKMEDELRRVNRALKTLSKCNESVILATDEDNLLRSICRDIVDIGGYRSAWVGFAEHDERKSVRPVAQAGYEEGYLETLDIAWADGERGRGPIGRAIRTGRPSIARKILTDPDFEPWRKEAVKRGYASFISLPLFANDRCFGALNIYSVEPEAFDDEEVKLLTELADDFAYGIVTVRMRAEGKRAEEELKRTLEMLRKIHGATIQAINRIVENRDPYTAGHQIRVADLARAIATEMKLAGDTIDGIRVAAQLHDLGKISVPSEILSKSGRLTEAEYSLIKNHPRVAYEILRTIKFPWPIADIILQHHERTDGSGYPLGLSGDNISIEARIIGVADVVEAMVSHRPYRPALKLEDALREISQKSGVLYDPKVADACLRLFKEKDFHFRA